MITDHARRESVLKYASVEVTMLETVGVGQKKADTDVIYDLVFIYQFSYKLDHFLDFPVPYGRPV